MIKIDYPDFQPRIKKESGAETIFDRVRKKWVTLTPEEWVRQNFVEYLIEVRSIPPALIAIEKEIQVGELKKRFDIVIYKDAAPYLLVECKAPEIALTPAVLEQALRYHSQLQVACIIITNGNYTAAFSLSGTITEMEEFPAC